ncbi:hypothetical protein CPSG_09696 [Coccidioides posadasii str. Silveira]|uniref:Uncharacterized protein n=1 Tax=Coccidioides posadasii (strain RMSCC 757 / Silveira) TaxID=443226 RepID=E9DIQ3_COCPS|nr:hypothetical protein CPSG_09696 [Coccidioides posadasii str. Silveira]
METSSRSSCASPARFPRTIPRFLGVLPICALEEEVSSNFPLNKTGNMHGSTVGDLFHLNSLASSLRDRQIIFCLQATGSEPARVTTEHGSAELQAR